MEFSLDGQSKPERIKDANRGRTAIPPEVKRRIAAMSMDGAINRFLLLNARFCVTDPGAASEVERQEYFLAEETHANFLADDQGSYEMNRFSAAFISACRMSEPNDVAHIMRNKQLILLPMRELAGPYR